MIPTMAPRIELPEGMSELDDYQLCPSCRGEFTFAVTRCAECEVDLVPASQLARSEAFPEVDALICIRVAPIPWIQALSDGLEGRGVPHRVEPIAAADAPPEQRVEAFGKAELFGLWVQEEDQATARELDGAIAAQTRPEEAQPFYDAALDRAKADMSPYLARVA